MTQVLGGHRVSQVWRLSGPQHSRDVQITAVGATHAQGVVIRENGNRLPAERQRNTSVAISALATSWHLIQDA
jgi:hypothetical protein